MYEGPSYRSSQNVFFVAYTCSTCTSLWKHLLWRSSIEQDTEFCQLQQEQGPELSYLQQEQGPEFCQLQQEQGPELSYLQQEQDSELCHL